MLQRKLFDSNKCECWECHKTFPYIGIESPMLNNDIWQKVASDEPEIQYYDKRTGDTWIGGGFLCKDCVEKRLGRPIEYTDLMKFNDGRDVPFNAEYIRKYFPEHFKTI